MSSNRRGRQAVFALISAVAVVAAAGCGSSSSSSSSTGGSSTGSSGGTSDAVKTAQQRWQDHSGAMKLEIGPSFDISKLKGKTIWFIAPTMLNPYVQQVATAVKKASAAAGINVQVWDGKGSTAQQAQGVQTAVSRKADGIILQAVDPKTIVGAMRQVTAAKIPIVDANNTEPDAPVTPPLFGHTSNSHNLEGRLQVDYALWQNNGKPVHALMTNVPIFPVFADRIKGIKAEMAELCPSTCALSVKNIDPSQPNSITTTVANAIQSDPKLNWIMPAYDAPMEQQVTAGIREAGATGRVRVVGSDNTNTDLVRKGSLAEEAECGPLSYMDGWGSVDLLARAMLNLPRRDNTVPERCFTRKDAPLQPLSNWTGIDYESMFKKAWGLQ